VNLFVLSPEIEDRDEVGHLAIVDFDNCHPCTWATRVTPQCHRLNIG
jgi:hypothetical protein